jgi:hypothetical protein
MTRRPLCCRALRLMKTRRFWWGKTKIPEIDPPPKRGNLRDQLGLTRRCLCCQCPHAADEHRGIGGRQETVTRGTNRRAQHPSGWVPTLKMPVRR